MAWKTLHVRAGISKTRAFNAFAALLLDWDGKDVGTCVGEGSEGGDEIPIMLGRDVGTGVDAGGQGVSNGSTSVTCKIGGSMPETLPGTALESRVPTTVAAKPWVWFPVLSHVPHKPNLRAAATTRSFPKLSSTTS